MAAGADAMLAEPEQPAAARREDICQDGRIVGLLDQVGLSRLAPVLMILASVSAEPSASPVIGQSNHGGGQHHGGRDITAAGRILVGVSGADSTHRSWAPTTPGQASAHWRRWPAADPTRVWQPIRSPESGRV